MYVATRSWCTPNETSRVRDDRFRRERHPTLPLGTVPADP